MEWQQLEETVRFLANTKWNCVARAETIEGVRCDCVLKPEEDYWVIIEVSKENNLSKLRTDLAKFNIVRPALHLKNTFCKCYFICERQPSDSLILSGNSQNVKVLSIADFEAEILNYNQYVHVRKSKKFGSAVDPVSGKKDTRNYVPVKYFDQKQLKDYSIAQIAELVSAGNKIVLLGEYGTGKSRCIQELFSLLAETRGNNFRYPFAIDLRENWGTCRAEEIIRRHFSNLGLSKAADAVLKNLHTDKVCMLLDGFDEIGSQTWSDDATRLRDIRKRSLQGVKEIITSTNGGIIITGREHYFNNSEELYECLGLSKDDTIILKCADEFDKSEMESYLQEISADFKLPEWLPRRPLICQIISEFSSDKNFQFFNGESDDVDFWKTFIDQLCIRESRIHTVLDSETIKKVLRKIARITRQKGNNVGPISIAEINNAFTDVTGSPPVDESAVMLQRLPALGRLSPESTDRQFIDTYILEGLRADDLSDIVMFDDPTLLDVKWINPLGLFGQKVLSQAITVNNEGAYIRLMKRASSRQNSVLAGDILGALLHDGSKEFDFHNVSLYDSHITFINFSSSTISNLSISQSVIEKLDITNNKLKNVHLGDCMITSIFGISTARGLPEWLKGNSIENFDSVENVARIRDATLNSKQRIFLAIIHKLFFQKGAGRKEEALLRGLGALANRRLAERILNKLLQERIISKFKGNEGTVYSPNRTHTNRMKEITDKLTLSEDPLWLEISS